MSFAFNNNTSIFLIASPVVSRYFRQLFSRPCLRFLFMWHNKTPGDGTLLGRTSRRFLWCWLLFSSMKVFTFSSYFSLPLEPYPGFSGPWRPTPALSSTLATFSWFTFARFFRHIFTPSATVLSVHFLPTGIFYLAPLPHIFDTFLWLRCGQEHLIQDLPLSMPLTQLSLLADASTWTTYTVVTRP